MLFPFPQSLITQDEEFWRISLADYYEQLVEAVRLHKLRLYLPGSETLCADGSYIMFGGYTRKEITDIQLVQNEDGTWEYREIIIQNFRIQRIMEKESGKTQAVLNTLLIPFQQYSLRYVLFHLNEFFSSSMSQENYCMEKDCENTFRKWLKWLREHITVLRELGLMNNNKENRMILGLWVREIVCDPPKWIIRSLQKLNLGLFQSHRMPENTKYLKYFQDG